MTSEVGRRHGGPAGEVDRAYLVVAFFSGSRSHTLNGVLALWQLYNRFHSSAFTSYWLRNPRSSPDLAPAPYCGILPSTFSPWSPRRGVRLFIYELDTFSAAASQNAKYSGAIGDRLGNQVIAFTEVLRPCAATMTTFCCDCDGYRAAKAGRTEKPLRGNRRTIVQVIEFPRLSLTGTNDSGALSISARR